MRLTAVILVGLFLPIVAHAQKLPDPDKVDPLYRDAAEKRRSELMKARFCTDRADKEKVLKRDLAEYVNRCVDSLGKAEAVTKSRAKQ